MIFVRSKDGVSHNPAEYSRPEDCAAGAQMLLGAYLRYDDHIRQQNSTSVTNTADVVKEPVSTSYTELQASEVSE